MIQNSWTLFVWEHGSATSIVAAAHFDRLAIEGLLSDGRAPERSSAGDADLVRGAEGGSVP